MKNLLFIIAILLLVTSCAMPDVYNIKDFGAKSGSRVMNTKYIQKAIDKCAQKGGTVYIPAGIYVTGTLILKSKVNFYLETGAILESCSDSSEFMVNGIKRGILFADNVSNVSITGHGEINGRAEIFHQHDKPYVMNDFDRKYIRQGNAYMNDTADFTDGPISYKYRPGMMIVFLHSSNITISDVTLKDSPEWTIRIGDCENVTINNISIMNNQLVPNSDGIHCSHSRNISISNCHITTGADGISISGFPYNVGINGATTPRTFECASGNQTRWSENITVTNCNISSRSSAISVGHGCYGIRNCTFQNITVSGSNRGIGVFVRDTASVEHILFNNIVIETQLQRGSWRGTSEPIHVSALAANSKKFVGKISNISFATISSTSENGILVWAASDSLIENIRFDNVSLCIKNSFFAHSYGGNIDLRPSANKKTQIFKHDISGIYCYHVTNLKLRNTEVMWQGSMAPYFTHALQLEKVNDAFIKDFNGHAATNNLIKAIDIIDSEKIVIQ